MGPSALNTELICHSNSKHDIFNINTHTGLKCNASIQGIHSGKVNTQKEKGPKMEERGWMPQMILIKTGGLIMAAAASQQQARSAHQGITSTTHTHVSGREKKICYGTEIKCCFSP